MTKPEASEPRPIDFATDSGFVSAFETLHNQRTPSSADLLDRAVRLASESMRAVDMQRRRIRAVEPEDVDWLFRVWMDYQFLIVALWRVRTSATIGASALAVAEDVLAARADFDLSLPDLARMRHVAQHLDDYAVDDPKRRRQRNPGGDLVGRRALEVGSFDGEWFRWLGGAIEVGDIRVAAHTL